MEGSIFLCQTRGGKLSKVVTVLSGSDIQYCRQAVHLSLHTPASGPVSITAISSCAIMCSMMQAVHMAAPHAASQLPRAAHGLGMAIITATGISSTVLSRMWFRQYVLLNKYLDTMRQSNLDIALRSRMFSRLALPQRCFSNRFAPRGKRTYALHIALP